MNGQHRVLVAEDELANLELLKAILSGAGYVVTAVESGTEALWELQRSPEKYSVILMDRVMPDMDGIEVLKKAKKSETLKNIPVIMQTGKREPADIRDGLEAGAFYYLTKPYERATLLAIVKAAVSDFSRYQALRKQTQKTVASFDMMVMGQFHFRTLEQADTLATLLAQICPEPEKTVMGLSELATNAVEHGNLGITYEDKTMLYDEDRWEDEIQHRLTLPENLDKKVILEFERTKSEIRFVIRDEGDGFDWREYMDISPDRATHTHGRGIAVSRRLSFSNVEYSEKGNKVMAVVELRP